MKIGVLGAGQLGRMLALAGAPLGLRFVFVDPAPGSPASELGEHVVTDYDDVRALDRLAECDVVTYEFESVPESAAKALEGRVPVHPRARALAVAQDRLWEKQAFRELSIAAPDFHAIDVETDLIAALSTLGTPAVLKTRRLGYDGKGQVVIREASEAAAAFARVGGVPLILEAFVDFERELSIVAARSTSGEVQCYPLVENQHRDGILRTTRAPATDTAAVDAEARRMMTALLEHFDYVGVLALELFQKGDRLFANEIAPRVHNSGHWTIEGARTSQFENHLRAILGLPLGDASALGPCAMLNCIGRMPPAAAVLSVPDAHLHDYEKEPRAGRKVGHVTVRAPDRVTLERRIATLAPLIDAGSTQP